MKLRTTHFRTVEAESAGALDEALASAKTEILRRTEEAQLIDVRVAASQGRLVATIIWTG